MKIVYGKGDLDKDDKIADKSLYVQGRFKNGYIYSVTAIQAAGIVELIDPDNYAPIEMYKDDNTVADEAKDAAYMVYQSRLHPGKVTYLLVRDKDEKGNYLNTGKYFESVAGEGDIVSITNADLSPDYDEYNKGLFGGISLVSKLIELEVNDGKLVQLYGLNNSSPINEDGAPCYEEEENGQPILIPYSKESYTAQMKITGDGGISIPGKDNKDAKKGYTVLIDRSLQDTTGKTPEEIKELEKNTYTGMTEVGSGSTLVLRSNYALGETSSAVLGAESTINLDGTDKTQFVASFNAASDSDVKFIKNGTLEIGNGKDAGTLGRISGEGKVIINASSLKLAGDYGNGEPTVSGSIQLEKNSKVFTDPSQLGWKQIGTSDIKLGDGSVLTINYNSRKEDLEKGYGKRILSGTGTIAIVNAEDSPIEEFVFLDKQPAGTFTGTLDLTKVNIDLASTDNNENLQQMTLVANVGATAKVGKTQIDTGNITLAGGTLDYSAVTNSYGTHEVINVLNSAGKEEKTFNFVEGNVQVNLSGDVPKYDEDTVRNVPLLDQDDGKIDIYLGYGKVEGSFGSVTINGKKIIDGTRVEAVYDHGKATLSYGIGLTDGKANTNGGVPQGFGLGYVLAEVHVNENPLPLELTPGKVKDDEGFSTLSALITSLANTDANPNAAGHLVIKGNGVDNKIALTDNQNSFQSDVLISSGTHLKAMGGALGGNGPDLLYTQEVKIEKDSTLSLYSGKQTIGSLMQKERDSVVDLAGDSTLILTKDSKAYGIVKGAGGLTVQGGELDIKDSDNSEFTGNLNIQNNALATTNKLESLGLSTVKVDKGGTLNLNLAKYATWSQNTSGATGVRTINGEGTVIKDKEGILTLDENYKLVGTTIVKNGGVYVGQKDAPLQAPGSFVVEKPSILRGFGSVAGLTNAGTVYMNDENLEEASPNTFVVNGDYVGQGGVLVFNAKLASDNDSLQDQLHIKGNASGSSIVRVRNLKGEGAETDEGIDLITINLDYIYYTKLPKGRRKYHPVHI